jgi:hypothetical protein
LTIDNCIIDQIKLVSTENIPLAGRAFSKPYPAVLIPFIRFSEEFISSVTSTAYKWSGYTPRRE